MTDHENVDPGCKVTVGSSDFDGASIWVECYQHGEISGMLYGPTIAELAEIERAHLQEIGNQ